MKLPPVHLLTLDWKPGVLAGWDRLVEHARNMEADAGKGDLFQQIVDQIRQMARTLNFKALPDLLARRVTARVLTQLWLDDEAVRKQLLTSQLLTALVNRQKPMLGIMPLHNLITLYFREFDRLDEQGKAESSGLRSQLEAVIREQLSARFDQVDDAGHNTGHRDVLAILHDEANWLLSVDGPKQLVGQVRENEIELADAFVRYELRGLDTGRYGDICRAHYYLDTLREIPVGSHDDVFEELLKPSVSRAPFAGGNRIGHAALEIMIDRADGTPGNEWQNFILDLAGDPRIASHAPNYREWWKPLGEERVEKVRGWFSKEDLRLFLRALEQYGVESGDPAIQRMFPGRKYFLEGLDKQKLIRNSRLMLGGNAAKIVKRILGGEIKTSFTGLSGDLSGTAVIYLDCGSFHILEGSHSFSFWIFLERPSMELVDYGVKEFSRSDFIHKMPAEYRKENPGLEYERIPHHGNWQNKVFNFLSKKGIGLDIESLLIPQEYNSYLRKHGVPVVGNNKTNLTGLSLKDDLVNYKISLRKNNPLLKEMPESAINIMALIVSKGSAKLEDFRDVFGIRVIDSRVIIQKHLGNIVVLSKDFEYELRSDVKKHIRI